jgi:DNA-binding PadR family transcriptional regulator
MGLISSTKLGILKELRDSPSHGYAIAQSLGVSTGGIYTHLDDLEAEGMIEIVEREKGGRRKKFYRLTQNGELLLEALGEA